jgi:hypothetical protein
VSIAAALGGVVTSDNEFCCDGGTAIVAFARRAGIPAHILPMPGKPNPKAPDFHLNNVNAYHGLQNSVQNFPDSGGKQRPIVSTLVHAIIRRLRWRIWGVVYGYDYRNPAPSFDRQGEHQFDRA